MRSIDTTVTAVLVALFGCSELAEDAPAATEARASEQPAAEPAAVVDPEAPARADGFSCAITATMTELLASRELPAEVEPDTAGDALCAETFEAAGGCPVGVTRRWNREAGSETARLELRRVYEVTVGARSRESRAQACDHAAKVIAASDGTATTLDGLSLDLVRNPMLHARLLTELETAAPNAGGGPFSCHVEAVVDDVSWMRELSESEIPAEVLADRPGDDGLLGRTDRLVAHCLEGAPDGPDDTRIGRVSETDEGLSVTCYLRDERREAVAGARSTESYGAACAEAVRSLCQADDCGTVSLTSIDGVPIRRAPFQQAL